MYYRDACRVPNACLKKSGALAYVACDAPCPASDTDEFPLDLRRCQSNATASASGQTEGVLDDTWPDNGCRYLEGSCTTRFARRSPGWCVPAVRDFQGRPAPATRSGTSHCREDCGQDYGYLDANGKTQCSCTFGPDPFPRPEDRCDEYPEPTGVETIRSCLCNASCTEKTCPCLNGSATFLVRAMNTKDRFAHVRYLRDFSDLSRVAPCKNGRCPNGWTRSVVKGYGRLAIARGYRLARFSREATFYHTTTLRRLLWHNGTCVCAEHCTTPFPMLECIGSKWRVYKRCRPLAAILPPEDLRNVLVEFSEPNDAFYTGEVHREATIISRNDVAWICYENWEKNCRAAPRIPLADARDCACLVECPLDLCPCNVLAFRLYRAINSRKAVVSLCGLDASGDAKLKSVFFCSTESGPPCPNGSKPVKLNYLGRKALALGYRYRTGALWLSALPVARPLHHGECVCLEGC